MKRNLFNSSKERIRTCFEGLNLYFLETEEEHSSDIEEDYMCRSIPYDLYNYCFSYYIFYRAIGNPNPDIEIFYPYSDYEEFQCTEIDNSIIWGRLIRVPKEDRDTLSKGRGLLLEMLKNPPDNRFMFDAN
jgi:hypothetical protein